MTNSPPVPLRRGDIRRAAPILRSLEGPQMQKETPRQEPGGRGPRQGLPTTIAPRRQTHTTAAQLPPVGPMPNAEALLVGALLWPRSDSDPGPVLALVDDDDIAEPALAEVLRVVRSMVYAHEPVGPALVLDELLRLGARKPVLDRLLQVTAAGAVPEALRGYARAVVSASLRRHVESAGHALTAAAGYMAEADLLQLCERASGQITETAARLKALRGGECP